MSRIKWDYGGRHYTRENWKFAHVGIYIRYLTRLISCHPLYENISNLFFSPTLFVLPIFVRSGKSLMFYRKTSSSGGDNDQFSRHYCVLSSNATPRVSNHGTRCKWRPKDVTEFHRYHLHQHRGIKFIIKLLFRLKPRLTSGSTSTMANIVIIKHGGYHFTSDLLPFINFVVFRSNFT